MSTEFTTDEIRLHDSLYRDAWELVKSDLQFHGRPPLGQPDSKTREKLEKAISLFEHVLKINPGNWNGMWALGKIYQRLNEHSIALDRFEQAHLIRPDNADILREATLCALQLGSGERAVEFAELATNLRPDDAGLLSNLALAWLIAGNTEEAAKQAENAVCLDPQGSIARNVKLLIEDVRTGRRPRPHTLS